MGDSHRIRTEIGVNKTINVELNQDFDFLEILSLKIQQQDIYNKSCSQYGVVVGRVTANNGFGIPNAKVSIFVPIEEQDKFNPEIFSIYPYTSPDQKNEDGYRYNLLPYEKSYSKHAATGTFPSVNDVLRDRVAIEVFDKYYKYTVKTNDSGDYMIMGAPLGVQVAFLDLDLSDIGEFSLTPQDLIRMGKATEAQVAGSKFKTSENLNSLPQIISLTKSFDVAPLWGDPEICQIAISRVDFDLRDDANIDIQPTSVFMGSMVSTPDKHRIRKNCKPKDNMGNLCELVAGPGQILAIRHKIEQDTQGNPVLEQYTLEQAGKVIDGSGAWLTELPMNLDYVITNEFGEKVFSYDPTIGIPTKGRYRFKIKWEQPPTMTEETKRAYFLVPNIREYTDNVDKSYYFGLDWNGYADPTIAKNCEDTFYEFEYNRVYTISGLIDNYKKGSARGRFIGIKEISSPLCDSNNNRFPVNDGVRNFDLLYFVFSFLFFIIQLIGIPFLIIYHVLAFLWNNFAVPLLVLLIAFLFYQAAQNFVAAGASTPAWGLIIPHILAGVSFTLLAIKLITKFREITSQKFGRLKVPMMTYPDCDACECETEGLSDGGGDDTGIPPTSNLLGLSSNGLYYDAAESYLISTSIGGDSDQTSVRALLLSEVISGKKTGASTDLYKTPRSGDSVLPNADCDGDPVNTYYVSYSSIPFGERINFFNRRENYFNGNNKIRVTYDYNNNNGKKHYDNTITILTNAPYETGQILSFVSFEKSTDRNYLKLETTTSGEELRGITGVTVTAQTNINVTYADSQTNEQTVTYIIGTGGTRVSRTSIPSDIEYFQVLTAITVADAWKIGGKSDSSKFLGVLDADFIYDNVQLTYHDPDGWWNDYCSMDSYPQPPVKPTDFYDNFSGSYITILVRGVDPYSPQKENQYGIGKILGKQNEDDIVITGLTRMNIPIQKLISNGPSVQKHDSQDDIFYKPYFFTPDSNLFSGYQTNNVYYYGGLDNTKATNGATSELVDGVNKLRAPSRYYPDRSDVSGIGFYYWNGGPKYVSPSLFSYKSTPMDIANGSTKIVMRTDRLPSSDVYDGSRKKTFTDPPVPLLQQNLGFATYNIQISDGYSTFGKSGGGDNVPAADFEEFGPISDVLETFTCPELVSLNCYSGNGINFGIKENCQSEDSIENGCYVFVNKPLKDLNKDLKSWGEWGYRFRFMYALCRGVLSEVFTNNWVNGVLYAYPIQSITYYDKNNKPKDPVYCKDLIHFDKKTNNFYYRSSPYNRFTNKFGVSAGQTGGYNTFLLNYPTTIINLGMKDSFYSEITLDVRTNAFIVDKLNPTSYSDTSDLTNLFVVSRIADEGFVKQLFSIFSNKNNVNQLFSRPSLRIDGDYAQLISINSEIGVTNFSPEFYNATGLPGDSVLLLGGIGNTPTIAVFFSSTTEHLQVKDYLTPGVINFRPSNVPNAITNAITYPFGIKSQVVPFYKWGLKKGKSVTSIFGSEVNDWATNSNDIFSQSYQSLDRRKTTQDGYFIGSNTNISDTFARGYIFQVDDNGEYQYIPKQTPNRFLVGAPFHFYFGLINGDTALDKFKTKYIGDE